MENFNYDWKVLVLQRWAGEFPPASEDDNADSPEIALKSSEDIASDLSGAGDFSADEVSAFLAVNGYGIHFEGGFPKWKIKAEAIGKGRLSE